MSSHSQSALNSLFSIYANNIKVNNPLYDNSSCLYATHYMTVRQQGSQLILLLDIREQEIRVYLSAV